MHDAVNNGATGPVLRSTGVKKDIRFLKAETYSYY
jgi:NADH:ubiquinone oxidoreductase subunit D